MRARAPSGSARIHAGLANRRASYRGCQRPKRAVFWDTSIEALPHIMLRGAPLDLQIFAGVNISRHEYAFIFCINIKSINEILNSFSDYLESRVATNYAITILNESECRSTFVLEYFPHSRSYDRRRVVGGKVQVDVTPQLTKQSDVSRRRPIWALHPYAP
jgi:hypothetical protein